MTSDLHKQLRDTQEREGGRYMYIGLHTSIIGLINGGQCLEDDQYHGVQRGIPSRLMVELYCNQKPLLATPREAQPSSCVTKTEPTS